MKKAASSKRRPVDFSKGRPNKYANMDVVVVGSTPETNPARDLIAVSDESGYYTVWFDGILVLSLEGVAPFVQKSHQQIIVNHLVANLENVIEMETE